METEKDKKNPKEEKLHPLEKKFGVEPVIPIEEQIANRWKVH